MGVAARIDPLRAWLGTVGALILALVLGSILFPRTVYANFIWQYFWGPVYADAHGAQCAAWAGGEQELLASDACATASEPVAYIGYTAVSEVGYALTLILAIIGVIFLLRRLDIGNERGFFYALVPYMFLGGALRVVEDANDAVPAGVEPAVTYPWNALLISPVIYFTMFAFTLATLLASVKLDREDVADGYELPLAAIGTLGLVAVLGYLGALAATTGYVTFHPQIAVIVLVGSVLITGVVWWAIERGKPEINVGTERMGAVVLFGHSVDGVANYVGIDWGAELGLPYGDLVPKHPVNRAMIDIGELFPASVQQVIGVSWPFLLLKIAAAVFVVYIFNDEVFEDSPRYAILLLVAIVAVGLGPGTRDMLRATFGI